MIDCLVEMFCEECMQDHALQALKLMSRVSPTSFEQHLATLQPFIKPSVTLLIMLLML